jgi:hypothetical protein
VTKPRKRWPGELDKPIRDLPAAALTHGGAITSANADNYNRRATEAIDAAVHAERLRKLPLIASHYGVGAQNYAGIAKALAQEFVRGFKDDIDDLRISYEADDNKALAVTLCVKFVPGFAYKPTVLSPERAAPFSDVDTEDERSLVSGAVRIKLAEGRPQVWTADKLEELLAAATKAKRRGLTDREALAVLHRRAPWSAFDLETLESRLQDGKRAKPNRA